MSDELSSPLSPSELQEWHRKIREASRNNVLCHCRVCDREWVSSAKTSCRCGSSNVEAIACWQFPDD
ncbi:MAG TPA: hypothetical protein ACFE0H_01095 [Elainellaceae cyanobacterium]